MKLKSHHNILFSIGSDHKFHRVNSPVYNHFSRYTRTGHKLPNYEKDRSVCGTIFLIMKDSSEIDSWNGSWYDDGETSDLKAYYEAKAKREEWSAGEVIIVEDLKEYDTQGCKEIDYRQPMETLVRDLEQEVRAELGAPPILAEVCT